LCFSLVEEDTDVPAKKAKTETVEVYRRIAQCGRLWHATFDRPLAVLHDPVIV